MTVHVEMRSVRLTLCFNQRRRLFQKRVRQKARSGVHGYPHTKVFVNVVVIRSSRWRLYCERLYALAIDHQRQLMRLVESLNSLVAVARQAELNLVFSVQRESVSRRSSAAS